MNTDTNTRVLLAKGKSNRIYTVPHRPDLVQKVAGSQFHVRSYCIQTQKRIHRLCAKALLDSPEPIHFIRIPALEDPDTPSYTMERVDTACPLYSESIALEPLLIKELVIAWKAFWAAGFAAWDYDLYLQSDGTVVLLDFDRFGFRMETDSLPPPPFFENSCFPPHFREMLS
jgi:hypothetical protein